MEKDYKKMYEDALNRAMNLALTNNISALAASEIFPELKESEDKKIMKDLKFYLEVRRCQTNDDEEYISCNKFLTWLESKSEQKSVEWCFPYGVNETVDKLIAIAECLEMDGDCEFNGYTGSECGKFLRDLARKQVECKPADEVKSAEWSEEDEEVLNNIITAFKRIGENCEHYFSPDTAKVFEKTLKSIKDKVILQSKLEWSEDYEKMLSKLIKHFEWKDTEYRFTKEDCLEAINWLKSLEDIIHPQPKQWWSEKDEQMFTQIIDEMEAIKSNSSTIFEKNIAQEKIDWLKSIKSQQNQYDKDKKLHVDWNEKIKGLDELETYILSLDPNRSLEAVKVDAKNICFLVNKDENKYDKGFNDGFSASEYNKILTEEDISHIDNIIGCLEEFTRPSFPIYKGNVFKEIKWLENLKNNK